MPRAANIVPYIVAGCMFMEILDGTVIATSLPAMAASFRVAPATLSLGMTAYMVAAVVVLPLNAWAAGRFGVRAVMALAMGLFIASSLACGSTTTLAGFTAMRLVQGAAAGLMSPSGRLAVLRSTPKHKMVDAVALLTWPALFAPIIGPPLGGFLTSFASWRWIFFLNLPLGVVGIALILRFMPAERDPQRSPIDLIGLSLGALALSSIIFGLELIGGGSGRSWDGAVLAAAGIGVAILTVRWLLVADAPLISLASARLPTFRISSLTGGTLTRIAIGATPFLLPLMLQTTLGYSAFAAGAITLVYFAGNLTMKTITTPLVHRIGFRPILVVNGALSALLVAACGFLALGMPLPLACVILFAAGASRSLQFTALNTIAFADTPPGQIGPANSLNSIAQQVAMTLGIAIAATALHASAGGRPVEGIDFFRALVLVAAIGLCGVLSYRKLAPDAGEAIRRRRRETADAA